MLNHNPSPMSRITFFALLSLLLTTASFARGPLFQDEVGLWAETVKRSPGKQRPYHNYGCALARAQRYDDAIRVLHEALSREPDGSILPYLSFVEIGNAHYHMNRYGDAVIAWRKALTLSPGNTEILTNIAEGLVKQGKTDEAWPYIQAALAGSSPYAETLEVLGEIHLARGDAVSAADSFVAAIKREPGLASAYRGAAVAYEKLGNYAASASYLEAYLSQPVTEQDRLEAFQSLDSLKRKIQAPIK